MGARLGLRDTVLIQDIEESLRLIRMSKASLVQNTESAGHWKRHNYMTQIFDKIREMILGRFDSSPRNITNKAIVIRRDEIIQQLGRDYSDEMIMATLQQYKA